MEARSEDGMPIGFKIQVGDKIKNVILAVSRAVESGNMTIFGADKESLARLARLASLEPLDPQGRRVSRVRPAQRE